MKRKIVFFGSGGFVVPVVEKLMQHGLDLVVTNDRNPNSPLLKFCEKNNVKKVIVSSASDLLDHLPLIIDHQIAVLASFGVFIPGKILNSFPNGIINIHPSLLPQWKGPSPVQYSLLNGDTQTGVTLIKLDDEIDHGPILLQKPYNLQGNETSEDLLSILFEIGADMVDDVLTKFENGEKIIETPQDHSKESWSYKITKEDGKIDLTKLPTNDLEISNWKLEIARKVRAFHPWPGVWFRNAQISHSERSEESRLSNKIIKLLPESRIQVEGKNPMSLKDFQNGFGDEGRQLLEKLHLI